MHDSTENGVLSLLETKPESCWRLDVRGASKVFDVVPRDCTEPQKAHDFFIKAEGFLTTKHGGLAICRGCCGGLIRARSEREDNLRVSNSLGQMKLTLTLTLTLTL